MLSRIAAAEQADAQHSRAAGSEQISNGVAHHGLAGYAEGLEGS